MILVDTSVLIDALRLGDAQITSLLSAHRGVICGIVLAELLHGARTPHERGLVGALAGTLGSIGIDDSIWEKVGDNLAALRASGVTVPFQDIVLATLAIQEGIELWTRDAHYAQIQTVLPALRLFQEPP